MATDGRPTLNTTRSPISNHGSVERDDVYYLETVVFRVENTLFRVPRRSFELDSAIFKSMFSLPTGQHNPEGQDDNSPIVLQGVKRKDFRSLVEMMYPMGPKPPELAHKELVGVLHLTTMWELAKIRERVIKIMDSAPSPMDAVERVVLAKKERISTWLRNGYEALVKEKDLTMDRLKRIDWETIAKLFYIRDKLPGSRELHFEPMSSPWGNNPLGQAFPDHRRSLAGQPQPNMPESRRAKELVEQTFRQELLLIEEEEYEKGWKDRPREPQVARPHQGARRNNP